MVLHDARIDGCRILLSLGRLYTMATTCSPPRFLSRTRMHLYSNLFILDDKTLAKEVTMGIIRVISGSPLRSICPSLQMSVYRYRRSRHADTG